MFPCKRCSESFNTLHELGRHTLKIHPKPKRTTKTSIKSSTNSLDKHIISKGSSMIDTLREQYEALNYQLMIRNLTQQLTGPQIQQPITATSKYKDVIEFMKLLQTDKSGLDLEGALKQIKLLREVEGAMAPQQSESLEDGLLKEAVTAFIDKQQQQPPVTQPPVTQQPFTQPPVTQPTDPNKITHLDPDPIKQELVGLDQIALELMTDKAKKSIIMVPKNTAYSRVKDFLNLTKDEFYTLYDKIKKSV